jgi:hypothetical protein
MIKIPKNASRQGDIPAVGGTLSTDTCSDWPHFMFQKLFLDASFDSRSSYNAKKVFWSPRRGAHRQVEGARRPCGCVWPFLFRKDHIYTLLPLSSHNKTQRVNLQTAFSRLLMLAMMLHRVGVHKSETTRKLTGHRICITTLLWRTSGRVRGAP